MRFECCGFQYVNSCSQFAVLLLLLLVQVETVPKYGIDINLLT